MRVTTETTVDDESTIAEFWSMYQTAFAPLSHVAATKQTLSEAEFRAIMAAPAVLKFVGWDRNDDPVSMVVLAADLTHVSWINPEFYEARYPEHAARGDIYYVVAALVRPTARRSLWFRAVLLETIKYVAARHGVGCLDCCHHNVAEIPLPRIVEVVSEAVAEVTTEQVDSQNYYTYVYHRLKERSARRASIDLTEGADASRPSTPAATEGAQR